MLKWREFDPGFTLQILLRQKFPFPEPSEALIQCVDTPHFSFPVSRYNMLNSEIKQQLLFKVENTPCLALRIRNLALTGFAVKAFQVQFTQNSVPDMFVVLQEIYKPCPPDQVRSTEQMIHV